MRDLILTGFMGTGKTTVGRILADRYGLDFVDMDVEIERETGKSIPDIFAGGGESSFRRIERDLLRRLAAHGSGRIIATGGGALVSHENRALLNPDHRVICLTCRAGALGSRLDNGKDRPLLAGQSVGAMRRLLEMRQPAYDLFEQVDTTTLWEDGVADEVARRVDLSSFSFRFGAGRVTRVEFGRGLVSRLGDTLRRQECTGKALLVTENSLPEHHWYREAMSSLIQRPHPKGDATRLSFGTSLLPAGEENKTLDTVSQIYRACMERGMDRSSTVIAIGGGVVGDTAGFAAATFMRGLRLVLVPTTLLAQVDASIGGKVAVDFDGVKNLVGAFHPAELVIVDPDVLVTLPALALADGLAEIVKIASVFSSGLLERVEMLAGASAIVRESGIIRRAAELKAQVVEADPYEHGNRALLNFGHTVGHGLEAASGYRLTHGQAISIGMIAEAWLAEVHSISNPGMLERLRTVLSTLDLPLIAPGLDPASVYEYMTRDKKRLAGKLRFALPRAVGEGTVVEIPESDARAAIDYAIGGAA